MSDAESGTHPVYIDRDLKKQVKIQATESELTMREVTERLIERGMAEGYHENPLPSEFTDDIEAIRDDIELARDEDDLDRAADRLDSLEQDLAGVEFYEDGATEEIEEALQEARDDIKNVRPQLTSDDEDEESDD